MAIGIFGKQDQSYDPIKEFIKTATIEIAPYDFGDGEGEVPTPVVSFSLNPGRGTGRQTIPVSELPQWVAVLETALDGDPDETIPVVENTDAKKGYVPTYKVLAQNLVRTHSGTMKEEYINRAGEPAERTVIDPSSPVEVMLRSKVGRGAKASHLPLERLNELIDNLSIVVENTDEYVVAAQNAYEAKLQRDVERAAKAAEAKAAAEASASEG